MKNKGYILYYCCICNKYTTVMHELVYGSGNRSISVEYNIQLPLCARHHDIAHDKYDGLYYDKYDLMTSEEFYIVLCKKLNIDPVKTENAVLCIENRKYLDTIKISCFIAIQTFEV